MSRVGSPTTPWQTEVRFLTTFFHGENVRIDNFGNIPQYVLMMLYCSRAQVAQEAMRAHNPKSSPVSVIVRHHDTSMSTVNTYHKLRQSVSTDSTSSSVSSPPPVVKARAKNNIILDSDEEDSDVDVDNLADLSLAEV